MVQLTELEARIAGEVIQPGHVDYEAARVVWNAVIDRRPAVIVRCANEGDVTATIQFARDRGLDIAVRGGGHSVAGFSTCDGGVVLDLSQMRSVVVDPLARRARVQGGALLIQLDTAAQDHGLVCPVGVVGHTGVGGLTLGGGMGRLQRRFGLTVDNVISVDLITAAGTKLHASEEENPDLFWGIRGAGPNFGVVTEFELQLHPMSGRIFGGAVAFPIDQSFRVVSRMREFLAERGEVQGWIGFSNEPELGGPIVVVTAAYSDPDGAEDDVRVLREGSPLVDTFGPKSYLTLQSMNDEPMSWGKRFYSKSGFLPELSDQVVEQCCAIADAARPGAELSMWAHGGAVGRVSDEAMAYTGRTAEFSASAETVWTDPTEDGARMSWGRMAMERLKPFMSTGRYVNEVVEADTPGAQIYGPAKYERLVALKQKYDPENIFHLNQNIKP